jgi:hypothetical protein
VVSKVVVSFFAPGNIPYIDGKFQNGIQATVPLNKYWY